MSTPPTATVASDEYILGPEDVIEVGIVGQQDKIRAKVYTDGTVQMNLMGRVQVAGRTTQQLQDDLAKILKAGGYYSNPVVGVEIVSFASRYVTVLGSVGAPGLVPINRPYRMSEILARVGGVRPDAADYLIVRSEQGPEKRLEIKAVSTGDASQDPFVQAGDKIYAPQADLFYISGQIRSPGTFPISQGMTIGQAIARSGGLTESGNDKRIQVTRAGKKLKLDVNAKVEAGDILVVSERLF